MESGKDNRRQLGKCGEDMACKYLQSLGHVILERNWRSGHLEVDIISSNADGIHFVEVKTRKDNIQAPPQENVGFQKQQRLTKAALAFLHKSKKLPYSDIDCLFDVIAITFVGQKAEIEWIPQAYIPIYL